MDRVALVTWTPIQLAVQAARICKDSLDRMSTIGDILALQDANLLSRLLRLDPAHESVVEHVTYTFRLTLSRGCLQEERRTRMSSPSVKSSRFTLGKQLRGDIKITDCLHKTGDEDVDNLNAAHLFSIQELADRRRAMGKPIPNDVLKYALIDAFLTEEFVTINARSLRNLFRTRLGKGVLREYQNLAWGMVDCLPGSHAVLFADVIQHVVERDGKESLSEYAQFVLETWPELLGTSLVEEHDQEESH